MRFAQSALLLLAASSVQAFFVTPHSRVLPRRQNFVSPRVSLSEESTSAEIQSEEVEPEVSPTEEVESVSEAERHTIYVGNLPYGVSSETVRELFSEHVEISTLSLPTNKQTGEAKGFAFIDVPHEDDIAKAVEALNGVDVDGRSLRVSKVLPKEQIRSKGKGQDRDTNKLFVGNLSFDASVDDVREFIGQFGGVTDVFLPVTNMGEKRGFAFVTIAEGELDNVLEAANGAEMMGRTLTVNRPLAPGEKSVKRSPRPQRNQTKLYVGNLSFYTNEDTLAEVFEEFGDVYDCYIPEDPERGGSRGFGFITMDPDAANEAIDSLDGIELDGRMIAVNEARSKREARESDDDME